MPALPSSLLFLSFHELISSRKLTHASSFRLGASGRSLFLFLTFLPRVNPLFPHPLHSLHPSSVSLRPARNDVLASLNLARVNADVIVIVSIYDAGRQGGARTQKWKKTERRSRRGNRSEETPGALCSARLLLAVNTIVLDDRDRVDNEIADRRYNRGSINSCRGDPRG